MTTDWRKRGLKAARDVLAMGYGLRDPKVPLLAKAAAALPVLYLLMPADLIPDVIPVLGWLDDIAALPLAALLFQRLVPRPVMTGLRDRADDALVRRTPRVRAWIVVAVAAWVALAALGGALFLRQPKREIPEDVMIERILSGELTANQ